MPRQPLLEPAEVSVLLTADCNLHCAYCVQNVRQPGVIEWQALRAALDLVLASPRDPRGISFAGGEPTLAFPLIRHAAEYLRRAPGSRRRPVVRVVTNGLLIEPEDVAFLARNHIRLDLSFDGTPEAQDLRAKGSFAKLDALVDRLRAEHEEYFETQFAVCVTVAREAVAQLAGSFEYFISKGVRAVAVHPAKGQPEWSDGELRELDRQLDRIVDVSREHYRGTGLVPFAPFAATRGAEDRRRSRVWGCSAPTGAALAVDVDGQVYPCAALARSCQAFTRNIDERVQPLALGDVRDPSLGQRLAALPEACRASGLFAPKSAQHSGQRRCARCRERGRCVVCPVARVARPGSCPDVNDIPCYLCAYERILARHRRRFVADSQADRGEALVMRILRDRRYFSAFAIAASASGAMMS